ncbi:hypothetical protein Tco_1208126 [Tanacetum coccineum]
MTKKTPLYVLERRPSRPGWQRPTSRPAGAPAAWLTMFFSYKSANYGRINEPLSSKSDHFPPLTLELRFLAPKAFMKLRFKLLFGLRPLKNSLEDGRGLDDLMDTQMTWMQGHYKEIKVESRNAKALSLCSISLSAPQRAKSNSRLGLAHEINAHVTSSKPATIQGVVSMASRLTTDGIKDGIFKKKENAGNKKRSNDQNMNRGMDDRNKRQRTGRNFALTASEQDQGQC